MSLYFLQRDFSPFIYLLFLSREQYCEGSKDLQTVCKTAINVDAIELQTGWENVIQLKNNPISGIKRPY